MSSDDAVCRDRRPWNHGTCSSCAAIRDIMALNSSWSATCSCVVVRTSPPLARLCCVGVAASSMPSSTASAGDIRPLLTYDELSTVDSIDRLVPSRCGIGGECGPPGTFE